MSIKKKQSKWKDTMSQEVFTCTSSLMTRYVWWYPSLLAGAKCTPFAPQKNLPASRARALNPAETYTTSAAGQLAMAARPTP